MRGFLFLFVRRLMKCLAVLTLMMVIALWGNGSIHLLGALLLGYFTGAVFVWTLGYRTWRSAALSASGAKKQMLWGLALRLITLFAVLYAAIHISVQVFGMTVLGFFIFYGTSMVLWMMANRERNDSEGAQKASK